MDVKIALKRCDEDVVTEREGSFNVIQSRVFSCAVSG